MNRFDKIIVWNPDKLMTKYLYKLKLEEITSKLF